MRNVPWPVFSSLYKSDSIPLMKCTSVSFLIHREYQLRPPRIIMQKIRLDDVAVQQQNTWSNGTTWGTKRLRYSRIERNVWSRLWPIFLPRWSLICPVWLICRLGRERWLLKAAGRLIEGLIEELVHWWFYPGRRCHLLRPIEGLMDGLMHWRRRRMKLMLYEVCAKRNDGLTILHCMKKWKTIT